MSLGKDPIRGPTSKIKSMLTDLAVVMKAAKEEGKELMTQPNMQWLALEKVSASVDAMCYYKLALEKALASFATRTMAGLLRSKKVCCRVSPK